jgi:hypothetical protein
MADGPWKPSAALAPASRQPVKSVNQDA